MKKITLVGCGLVGGSWSLVFARAGFEVTLYDPAPASVQGALDFAAKFAPALAEQGLLNGQDPAAVLSRLKPAASLAEALKDADYVQESAPERQPIKEALYKEMAPLLKAGAIVGSSTSGLPPSSFTAGMPGRERCLVAHPINPPHLIPLVEIVPAPWTSPAVVDETDALMKQLGQVPIRVSREIAGFLVNRLQCAILGEAFRLVEDGVCSAADIDAAIKHGLGMRWFFMGPFETIDLNAPRGISEYCANFNQMYYGIAKEQADPRLWSDKLVAEVEKQRRVRTQADELDARKAWRDRCLVALVKAKRAVLAENGD
jgi:3-hydroxyacyl-CoA dehydrogenase